MNSALFTAFLLATVVLIVIPGPNVLLIKISPNALYLSPGPPVYTKADPAPATSIVTRVCSGAFDIAQRGTAAAVAAAYQPAMSLATCSGRRLRFTSVRSDEVGESTPWMKSK